MPTLCVSHVGGRMEGLLAKSTLKDGQKCKKTKRLVVGAKGFEPLVFCFCTDALSVALHSVIVMLFQILE